MKNYLILQYPYEFTETALCREGKVIKSIQEDKFNAVKRTIPNVQDLLNQHNITLQDIDFIGVNTGPGPYNTLRALITTVNGIHFVKQTPLISLSALDLLLSEHDQQPTVAILNAFANHVFYAFNSSNNNEQGYCSIDSLIQKITDQPKQLTLVGNGAQMHQKKIIQEASGKITIPKEIPLFNNIDTLAKHAYQAYQLKNFSPSYLMPKYLHSPAIKN